MATGAGPRPNATQRKGERRRGWLTELVGAAAVPVACAVALVAVLSAWVASGGGGTLTRVQIQVTLAAVPVRGFTAQSAADVHAAHTYLIIRNLAATPDELTAVRSPVSSHVVLTRRVSLNGPPAVVGGLQVPAKGTLSLTPLTDDVVLDNPAPFEQSRQVPLTLVFRNAGQVTIEARVIAGPP
jgi:copper(I)-binding protein